MNNVSFHVSFTMMSFTPLFAILIGVLKYQYRKRKHNNAKKHGAGKPLAGRTEEEHHQCVTEGLKIAFNIADKDNSGFIDVHEFAELVRNLGYKKFKNKHAQKLFNKRSADGDAFLDQEEFFALVLDPKNKIRIDVEVIAWSSQRRDMYHAFADVSQLLLLVHTPVARNFFAYFECVDVGGRSYLKQDVSLRCDDDTYFVWMGFILFAGIVFVIGFPLGIGIYLFKHRNELYAVRVTDKIGFLYDRFQKGSEFWELHEMMRKVILTGVAVSLNRSPMLQIMMSTLVCLLAQVNLNYFRPHKNSLVFIIAQVCFTAITTKYLVALLLMGNEAAALDDAIGGFLIAIDIGTTAAGITGLFLAFFVLFLKMREIAKKAKEKKDGVEDNSTKVVPISDDAKEKVLLEMRDELMDDIVKYTTNIQLSTQTETLLHTKLMKLMEIEKTMYETLIRHEDEIEDFKRKIHVLATQLKKVMGSQKSGSKSSPSDLAEAEAQLKELKRQLRLAQQKETGVISAGIGQRATTLVTLLKCLFRKYDPNATGHLGQPELRDLFVHVMLSTGDDSNNSKVLKTADNDAMTVIRSVDTDNNGTVEESEFVDWIKKGIAQDVEKRKRWGAQSQTQGRLLAFLTGVVGYCQTNYLKSIFLEFDRDQDDALSKTELVALMVEMKMRSITQADLTTSLKSIAEDANIVLKALDADQNGTVELDEFVDWLTEGLSRPSNERKKWAMQGGIYKRLEHFLVSVEETAAKNGLDQWTWASSVNNDGNGQARFIQTPQPSKAALPKFKHKSGITRKKTSNGSYVDDPLALPPPPKAVIFHQKRVEKPKPVEKKIKRKDSIDTSKFYLDASDVTKDELVSIFSLYDTDKKGGISGAEMHDMMQKRKKQMGVFVVTEKDCSTIMNALDADKNGMIEMEEFANWIMAGLQRSPEDRAAWSQQNSTCHRLDQFLSAVHNDVINSRRTPESEE